ncbi:hypothetical protein KKG72_06995 [bacterium]|nr:hypothetical protein [bacterium]MBU1993997.1 hypothetical protein [bacterium]
MYIKRYTIATLIFVVLIGWYVYSFITQGSISIDFFGVPLPSLSIALWAIVPVILLYVGSIVHMSFYSLMGNFKLRKYEKDYEKLIDAFVDAYLGKENRNHTFKTPRYTLLGSLVDKTTLFPSQNLKADTENEKINAVINIVENIKNGEVVDLKKYSLQSSNPFVIQNDKNRYKKGMISAEDILTHPNKYDRKLSQEVYVDFVKKAPLYAIEKYKTYLTKDALFELLSRINSSENILDISNESLINLMSGLEFDTKDYIKMSTILSYKMIPEHRMKLFEILSSSKEEAMEAYLFTLFDLEMLAPADEILENSQSSEYVKFKAYRALKERNKNFNINLFI